MLSKKDVKEECLKKYVNYPDLKIGWPPAPENWRVRLNSVSSPCAPAKISVKLASWAGQRQQLLCSKSACRGCLQHSARASHRSAWFYQQLETLCRQDIHHPFAVTVYHKMWSWKECNLTSHQREEICCVLVFLSFFFKDKKKDYLLKTF